MLKGLHAPSLLSQFVAQSANSLRVFPIASSPNSNQTYLKFSDNSLHSLWVAWLAASALVALRYA
jgi:hypothetical protein